MITRGERRRLTNIIIRKRKWKLLNILNRHYTKDVFEEGKSYIGELRNNNIMNQYSIRAGIKTKARKACITYRHHGTFGPAKRYMHHDKQQIEDGEIQLKEFSYN